MERGWQALSASCGAEIKGLLDSENLTDQKQEVRPVPRAFQPVDWTRFPAMERGRFTHQTTGWRSLKILRLDSATAGSDMIASSARARASATSRSCSAVASVMRRACSTSAASRSATYQTSGSTKAVAASVSGQLRTTRRKRSTTASSLRHPLASMECKA